MQYAYTYTNPESSLFGTAGTCRPANRPEAFDRAMMDAEKKAPGLAALGLLAVLYVPGFFVCLFKGI